MKDMVKLGAILFAICAVASLVLGVTNNITSPVCVRIISAFKVTYKAFAGICRQKILFVCVFHIKTSVFPLKHTIP